MRTDHQDRLNAALAGRYTIERELGRGGMATVYLARDVKHHRQVAVKVLRPELAAALGPDRFLREAEIAARLNHPHILALYDSGEAGGFLFYVMPYVAGESLRHRLARAKQLPVEEALGITRHVASALGHAHAQNVIHRDIKPENILLYEGEAMVADFGIAVALAAPATDRPRTPSVAVLPFLNLSTDSENEYFADGITEDVIAQLSKVGALQVISRTSVMPFKKREQGLREIAARLQVATLLEGSVRRAGDRVRIVAQLIDAETDQHLWVETYDRQLTDIFAIQADVAVQIAAALQAELSPDERTRIHREPTRDLEAYQLYLQGRHWFSRYTVEGVRKGIEYLEQAIARDPQYAPAHVGLALAWAHLGVDPGGGAVKPAVAYQRAKAAVTRALALDGGLGEAHAGLGLLKFVCDFDWTGAEEEFRLALDLSPGSADTYDHYGWMCAALGRYDEAIAMLKRAQELDPLAHGSDVASTLLRAGRYEEAAHAAARVIEFDPRVPRGHSTLGWAKLKMGQHAEGLAELEQAVALDPGNTLFLAQLGQAFAEVGRVADARAVLRQLQQMTTQRDVSPYHLAYVYVGLGEQEAALDALERAFVEREGAECGIKSSFLFTPLHSHPRFTALLRKMNLA